MKSRKLQIALFILSAVVCIFAFAGCTEQPEATAKGEFYSLQQAYDANLISLEDLKNIAYNYNGGSSYNDEIMADFTPAEKAPLSVITQKAIKQSHAQSLRETLRPDGTPLIPDASAEHVTISGYYGTYNGGVAVMIEDDYSSYDCAMWMVAVEGVNIYYNDGNRIKIWKQL